MTGKSTEDQLRVALPVAALDVLELVRTGALPSYPLDAPPGSVTLPLAVTWAQAGPAEVELADLEGVPVARMPLARTSGGPAACGVPTWLSPRSRRPFEDWHAGPAELAPHTGLVVLRAAADPDELAEALRAAGSHPLLLVLGSFDGDADPAALDAARQARAMLDAFPAAQVAVTPVPPSLTPDERDAVVRSYAGGGPVTMVEPAAGLPLGSRRTVLFLTGLSGSGKSTLGRAVRNRLVEDGNRVTLLDGDVVRRHLSAGLGFSAADRDTNVRRIGWVAAEIVYHGGIAVCCPIAPFEHTREEVRRMVESRGGRFVLVHVATPLTECERRDRKGLYARARRGELEDFTGISSPYEEPVAPDLRVDTTGRDVDELARDVLVLLAAGVRC